MSLLDLIAGRSARVVSSPMSSPSHVADNVTRGDCASPERISCAMVIEQSEDLDVHELFIDNCDNLIDLLN